MLEEHKHEYSFAPQCIKGQQLCLFSNRMLKYGSYVRNKLWWTKYLPLSTIAFVSVVMVWLEPPLLQGLWLGLGKK